MFRIRKGDSVGKLIFLAENIFLMLGAGCLFFNLTPGGVNPKAPNEAWYFALPFFAAAAVLCAADFFWKRKR